MLLSVYLISQFLWMARSNVASRDGPVLTTSVTQAVSETHGFPTGESCNNAVVSASEVSQFLQNLTNNPTCNHVESIAIYVKFRGVTQEDIDITRLQSFPHLREFKLAPLEKYEKISNVHVNIVYHKNASMRTLPIRRLTLTVPLDIGYNAHFTRNTSQESHFFSQLKLNHLDISGTTRLLNGYQNSIGILNYLQPSDLRYLNLSRVADVTAPDVDVAAVLSLLPNTRNLQVLDISRNRKQLTNTLYYTHAPRLRYLDVSGNAINMFDSFEMLLHPTLQILHVEAQLGAPILFDWSKFHFLPREVILRWMKEELPPEELDHTSLQQFSYFPGQTVDLGIRLVVWAMGDFISYAVRSAQRTNDILKLLQNVIIRANVGEVIHNLSIFGSNLHSSEEQIMNFLNCGADNGGQEIVQNHTHYCRFLKCVEPSFRNFSCDIFPSMQDELLSMNKSCSPGVTMPIARNLESMYINGMSLGPTDQFDNFASKQKHKPICMAANKISTLEFNQNFHEVEKYNFLWEKGDAAAQVTGLNHLRYWSIADNGMIIDHTRFQLMTEPMEVLIMKGNNVNLTQVNICTMVPHLKKFDLSDSKIAHIPRDFLQNCSSKVQYMDVAGNAIHALDFSLGDICSSRDTSTPPLFLNLSFNHIVSVGKTFLNEASHCMRNLSLDLSGNRFSCDCSSLDFVQWLKETSVLLVGRSTYSCVYRGALHQLVDVDMHELHVACRPAWVYVVSGGVSSTASVFLVLIITRNLWKNRHKLKLAFKLVRAKWRGTLGQSRFKYIAYIAYASEDRHWVHGEFLEKMEAEFGFKLFIRMRDGPVGGATTGHIVDMLTESRMVVLITSRTSVERRWWLYESVCAIHNEVRTNKRVIVIKTDNVILGRDETNHMKPFEDGNLFLTLPEIRNNSGSVPPVAMRSPPAVEVDDEVLLSLEDSLKDDIGLQPGAQAVFECVSSRGDESLIDLEVSGQQTTHPSVTGYCRKPRAFQKWRARDVLIHRLTWPLRKVRQLCRALYSHVSQERRQRRHKLLSEEHQERFWDNLRMKMMDALDDQLIQVAELPQYPQYSTEGGMG